MAARVSAVGETEIIVAQCICRNVKPLRQLMIQFQIGLSLPGLYKMDIGRRGKNRLALRHAVPLTQNTQFPPKRRIDQETKV